MHEIFQLMALAVVVFASTNIDDIFVLLGFFADPKLRPRQVVVGQYLGVGALYLISVVGSLVSLVLPPQYVGLLGVAPILIGVRKFYHLISSRSRGEGQVETHGATGILEVASVTVANGGDNLGVYTPLFATRSALEISVIGVVF